MKGMGNAHGGSNDIAGAEKMTLSRVRLTMRRMKSYVPDTTRKQQQHRFMPKKLSAYTRTGNYS